MVEALPDSGRPAAGRMAMWVSQGPSTAVSCRQTLSHAMRQQISASSYLGGLAAPHRQAVLSALPLLAACWCAQAAVPQMAQQYAASMSRRLCMDCCQSTGWHTASLIGVMSWVLCGLAAWNTHLSGD